MAHRAVEFPRSTARLGKIHSMAASSVPPLSNRRAALAYLCMCELGLFVRHGARR